MSVADRFSKGLQKLTRGRPKPVVLQDIRTMPPHREVMYLYALLHELERRNGRLPKGSARTRDY